ncbi:mobile element protein [Thermus aquaticus Y51MC23]|uniref:Mobile element protein n=1 Tax=Thermus aquaticus (strain ATCC BAA-2747 / Y51MC23) TaxID=498848 RepID=A0ABM5VNK8_THEA5|nr:mobile element protein [Thermus aquaticus Y51MC23]ALJ91759.1 mobile element protein [Thermus aquaticus Y51MC23]
MPLRRCYPSDLTDEEWGLLEPLIPAPKPGGRPAKVSRREIMNAILIRPEERHPLASHAP